MVVWTLKSLTLLIPLFSHNSIIKFSHLCLVKYFYVILFHLHCYTLVSIPLFQISVILHFQTLPSSQQVWPFPSLTRSLHGNRNCLFWKTQIQPNTCYHAIFVKFMQHSCGSPLSWWPSLFPLHSPSIPPPQALEVLNACTFSGRLNSHVSLRMPSFWCSPEGLTCPSGLALKVLFRHCWWPHLTCFHIQSAFFFCIIPLYIMCNY